MKHGLELTGTNANFAGYLIARGTQELAAAQLRITRSSLAALNAAPLFGGAAKLYAPRFSTDGGYASQLNIVNPNTSSVTLRLRAIDDSGTDLVQPATVVLGAGRQWRASAAQLFGLNTSAETTGSIIVESSERVFGTLSLHDAAGRDEFRSAFALASDPSVRMVFAHPEAGPGKFTEISVLNPNPIPANVTVTVYQANGTPSGAATWTISSEGRFTRKLAELISASAGVSGGFFVVESSEPVLASALAGEDSRHTLSAVPSSAAALAAPPATTGSLKADYEFQNTLSSSVGSAPALAHLGDGNTFVSENVNGSDRVVLRFPRGNGLSLPAFTDLVPSNCWSIVILFRFEAINGYRRIIDLKNSTSDLGLYSAGGVPYYFNEAYSSITAIQPNAWTQIVLTRAADNTLAGYADGKPIFQFNDQFGRALPSAGNNLVFFRDNNGEDGGPGAVAQIRLYDTALTPVEVLALQTSPTPPRLGASVFSNQLLLQWPATASGFSLQSTASLSPPITWTSVTSTVTPSGEQNTVSVNLSNAPQFYRLAR